mgnify:CR=1 FL=1
MSMFKKYPKVNYIGNKEKIATWICEHFPADATTLFDAFSGGCSLSYTAKLSGLEVYSNDILTKHLLKFEESNIHDPGLINFPPSRPATTKLAKETGEALGIKVKESGNRKMQPIVNKFFFWLRIILTLFYILISIIELIL